jgi:type I restriction-modification system DNA methylase subunit
MSIKNFIRETFRSCLDILRDSEYLTGDKALRPLGFFLQLRLLESQFGKEIDIDNPVYYDFKEYEFADNKELCDKHLAELLRLARFSYLAKVKEDNLKTYMEYLWNDILSVHPATKSVFLKGRGFELKKQTTYKKIIDKLASVEFENIDEDILGEAYEEVVKDIMTGKTLGQFFTPPVVKQMMVELIDPQIHPDGTTESVFDPAMGTGGFLITCMRYLINKSKRFGTALNWNSIRNGVISGRECEPQTFQLAVSNMLISSGKMFHLEHGDSIRNPIVAKYDIVLANPPFGIKGLDYDEITDPLRNEYLPIRSKSSTPLFLQAIIYMLKINGRCAVVLPDGQDLFSKSKALVTVRKYLMKTCDLKEVIYLPPGMFTHTTIKTCVFYFQKRKEQADVLETKIIFGNSKEIDRVHVFTEAHQTEKVIFSEFNGTSKTVITEVGIEQLAKNDYSLNAVEYLAYVKIGGGSATADGSSRSSSSNIIVKTLGEICQDVKTSKSIPSSKRVSGNFKFFTCSPDVESHDTSFYEGSFIIQGSRGTIVGSTHYTDKNEKFAVGTSMFLSKVIDENVVLTKYVFYYLKFTPAVLRQHINGTAIPMINKENYYHIQIPLPPLAQQKEIVERLDFFLEKCNGTNAQKILQLRQQNVMCFETIMDGEVKTLAEVCDFKNGKGIKKENLEPGEYPVIGGGKQPLGYHNKYNMDENVVLCSSSGASAGYISRYAKKVWASDCFSIKPKASLNSAYLYYFLKLTRQSAIYAMQTGTAQPHIYSKNLETMNIIIPSLDKQKYIVDFCEANDLLIQQLKKNIEQNTKFAESFIQAASSGSKKRKHDTV